MKTTRLIWLPMAAMIFQCSGDRDLPEAPCAMRATVVDLRGLDGCGFVFKLDDGTQLEPLNDVNDPADPCPVSNGQMGKWSRLPIRTRPNSAAIAWSGRW